MLNFTIKVEFTKLIALDMGKMIEKKLKLVILIIKNYYIYRKVKLVAFLPTTKFLIEISR